MESNNVHLLLIQSDQSIETTLKTQFCIMAILQKSEFIFVPFNRLSTILPPLKYYIKYIIHKMSEIVPPQIAF